VGELSRGSPAPSSLRGAALDAVTLDAHGTLLGLVDPVPALDIALRARGIEREPERIRAAFDAEARVYVPRSLEGRDAASLARLRDECAAVFLHELGADGGAFGADYAAALRFEPLPGVLPALARLRSLGLALAIVANWDCGLHDHLERAGIVVDVVVTSAEAGLAKPDPVIFRLALDRLGVAAERALHIGDSRADEEGARAAGLAFLPAPVADAVGNLR
jgi:putative hydrolase of the HAD superfamily